MDGVNALLLTLERGCGSRVVFAPRRQGVEEKELKKILQFKTEAEALPRAR